MFELYIHKIGTRYTYFFARKVNSIREAKKFCSQYGLDKFYLRNVFSGYIFLFIN